MNTIKQKDNYGGEYYLIEMPDKSFKFDLPVEKVENFKAFCASYMKDPFFMGVKSGGIVNEIPYETQWLAILHTDNRMHLPLLCGLWHIVTFYTQGFDIKAP